MGRTVAELGHEVVGIDVDQGKIDLLVARQSSVFELGFRGIGLRDETFHSAFETTSLRAEINARASSNTATCASTRVWTTPLVLGDVPNSDFVQGVLPGQIEPVMNMVAAFRPDEALSARDATTAWDER